jgi:hypothetical protein
VCHQSVGLIAREIERRGIPTISLTSAWSITRAVNPPRAAFVDFPLGHTAGKPDDKPLQRKIMIDTLSALDSIMVPGEIRTLPYQWSADHSWKDRVMRPQPPSDDDDEVAAHGADDRLERTDEPQYQQAADRRAVAISDGCPGCVFLSADSAR